MAPVTGAISDAEQYGTVQIPGAFEGILTPGIPVDRVILMLPEIR